MEAAWSAKVTLEHVEKAYSSNLVQVKSLNFAASKDTVSGKEIHSGIIKTAVNQSATAAMKAKSVNTIPEATMEEEKSDEGTAEEVPVGGSCSAPPTVESDAFRIRGAAPKPLNAKPANAAKGEKPSGGDGGTKTVVRLEKGNGILDNLRIVFPSAYNFVLTHPSFEDIRQQASPEVLLHDPVMTLDPCSLGDCSAEETLRNFDSLLKAAGSCELFLSEERYNMWRQLSEEDKNSSWMQMLKPLVQKSPTSVSLSLLVLVRMEASVMAAYDSVNGTGTASMDHPMAPAAVEAMEVKIKPEQKSGMGKGDPSVTLPGKTHAENVRKSERASIHAVAEAVTKHASQVPSNRHSRAMEHIRNLVPKKVGAEGSSGDPSFVLLPFSHLVHSKEGASREKLSPTAALLSWNSAVETALITMMDDADASEKNETKKCTNEASADPKPVPQSGHDLVGLGGYPSMTPAKKSKKKKKKKVRSRTLSLLVKTHAC